MFPLNAMLFSLSPLKRDIWTISREALLHSMFYTLRVTSRLEAARTSRLSEYAYPCIQRRLSAYLLGRTRFNRPSNVSRRDCTSFV